MGAPSRVPDEQAMRIVGRYALHAKIAAGGMATVHLGRLLGPVGFSRTVAIKRLHAQLAQDPEFVAMFLDEARLAARIRHPNVVPTLDVVATKGELFLVMDYVHGDSLWRLMREAHERRQRIPTRVVVSIMSGVLHGLHAAHEARSERGDPLGIVHRDVSPQNVLVGVDGVARVLDFGVAKASGRMHESRSGNLKGKIPYMAPEQLGGELATRQSDIYAAGVMLWEMLTGERLFTAKNEAALVAEILEKKVAAPSQFLSRHYEATILDSNYETMRGVDEVVLKAMSREPGARFASAKDMALALEREVPPASPAEVATWVEWIAHATLDQRAMLVAAIESHPVRKVGRETLMRSLENASEPRIPAFEASDTQVDSRSLVSVTTTKRDPGKRDRFMTHLAVAMVSSAVVSISALLIVAKKNVVPATPAIRSEPAMAVITPLESPPLAPLVPPVVADAGVAEPAAAAPAKKKAPSRGPTMMAEPRY